MIEALIATGFTFYASPEVDRMRNSLIAAGIATLFYINDIQNKNKTNVLNYNTQ